MTATLVWAELINDNIISSKTRPFDITRRKKNQNELTAPLVKQVPLTNVQLQICHSIVICLYLQMCSIPPSVLQISSNYTIFSSELSETRSTLHLTTFQLWICYLIVLWFCFYVHSTPNFKLQTFFNMHF